MIINTLTPKQYEILLLIYRFRFLDRIHIQTLLHHKDPKRINVWLKDLVGGKYLSRSYSKKLLENTKPAVYWIAPNGIRLLKENPTCRRELLTRLYRDGHRSTRFVQHCLFIAFIYVDLFKESTSGVIVQSLETKTDLAEYGNLPSPLPDLMFELSWPIKKRVESTTQKYHHRQYFLELIDENTPRFALRHRVKQYIEYFETTTYDLPVQVLFVCPNTIMHSYLTRFIKKALEDFDDSLKIKFKLCTKDDLREKGVLSEIWTTLSP